LKHSTEYVLTTHTGSLPRPTDLAATLERRDQGAGADPALPARIQDAVREVVHRQIEAGVRVVNDGEAGKSSYSTYVKERLDGFGGRGKAAPPPPDAEDFPEYWHSTHGRASRTLPACVGELVYRDRDAVRADIASLRAALATASGIDDAFLTAASPGVIALFLRNQHYPSHEAYVFALAEAMKAEYDEINAAGFVLQLDCPDLAAGRYRYGETAAEFRRRVALHLEALDHATRDVPADRLRLHLCWGNYEGPHHRDMPLRDILDLVLASRPSAISFEAANPRHAHEWTVFEDVDLPDGKLLIPGVLDSTTNYVEHPELVAQRIVRYAELVGRENVIAGSDCGFATFATEPTVHPSVAWAKLRAMADGARLASRHLWKQARV
jgi:5-methyltetrahydropteroyltriglutamate--homocysteine methyltransferase